jgi:hypothetical protein
MLSHTEGRECPICKGFCRLVKVNSLTPYEEIDAEVHRKKTNPPDEADDDLQPLFSRKKITHHDDESVEPTPSEFRWVKHY